MFQHKSFFYLFTCKFASIKYSSYLYIVLIHKQLNVIKMLNHPSGTRAYEIEAENESYEDTVCLLKFKKEDANKWFCGGFIINKRGLMHDGYGFTTLFVLYYKEKEIGRFYRLKNAKKASQEYTEQG